MFHEARGQLPTADVSRTEVVEDCRSAVIDVEVMACQERKQ